MVTDRNRQIIERRHSGESVSAIGIALEISRERVRQIVEREQRRDQRAQELEEAARLPQQPNPLQLTPRLRNMLAKLFGTPDFTPDGNQIVFSSTLGGSPANLYVSGADGSGIRRLTSCVRRL